MDVRSLDINGRRRRNIVRRATLVFGLSQAMACSGSIFSTPIPGGEPGRDAKGTSPSTGPSGPMGDPGHIGDAKGTTGPQGSPITSLNNDLQSGPPDLSVATSCNAETVRGSARESVRRLTRTELLRTIQVSFPSLFEYIAYPDNYRRPAFDLMRDYPPEVPEDPNENFNALHSEPQVEAWMEVADWAGGQVAASEAERMRYGGDCMKGTTFNAGLSGDCLSNFTGKLARQLFRRPATAEEVQRAVSLSTGNDQATRVQITVAYLLRSPNTMLHLALGDLDDGKGRVRLTAYEVAEQLSYGLTSAPPDADLNAAADGGQLETLDQIRAQANRLVRTDLAKDRFKRFVGEWLRTYKIPTPLGDQALPFPNWLNATQYLDNMYRDEINEYFQYVVWNLNGSFYDLMTLPVAVPIFEKLADIYGVAPTKSGVPRDTPDHPGLLTRAGLLASGLNTTSPILRGVMILRRVLCSTLPSPDATIVATRLSQLNVLDPKTMSNQEIVSQTTAPPNCMTCHSKINPYGFLLETYNPLGIRKPVQEYIGAIPGVGSKLFSSFPLPGPQTLSTDTGKTDTYVNPNDLVAALGESANAQSCLAVRLFRSLQQRPEQDGDACAIAETASALKEDKPLLDVFVASVANEDLLWRKPL